MEEPSSSYYKESITPESLWDAYDNNDMLRVAKDLIIFKEQREKWSGCSYVENEVNLSLNKELFSYFPEMAMKKCIKQILEMQCSKEVSFSILLLFSNLLNYLPLSICFHLFRIMISHVSLFSLSFLMLLDMQLMLSSLLSLSNRSSNLSRPSIQFFNQSFFSLIALLKNSLSFPKSFQLYLLNGEIQIDLMYSLLFRPGLKKNLNA